MTRFRICTVGLGEFPHAACFTDVSQLLEASFRSLGIDCDVGDMATSGDRCRVVLGYHLLRPGEVGVPKPYVVYQLESMTPDLADRHRSLFANAVAVWDYSARNIEVLAQRGIAARFLPVGYHSALNVIASGPHLHDVLFYGSLTPRRVAVLDALRRRGLNVRVLFGVYGKERDEAISASRIVLNIQQAAGNRFESVRVAWLLNNCCFVVSEAVPDVCAGVVCVPYDELESACVHFAGQSELRKRLAERGHNEFRTSCSMVDLLRTRITDLNLP